MEPDHTHLMFGYHQSIISSLVMIEKLMQNPTGGVATLLIGLGGGALPMFLHKCFPQVRGACQSAITSGYFILMCVPC